MAKSALVSSWKSGTDQKHQAEADSDDASRDRERDATTSSIAEQPPSNGLYNLLSRSSSAVTGGIKSLARKTSQLDIMTPSSTSLYSQTSSRNSSENDFIFEVPPLEPVKLEGYDKRTKTHILNEELASEIRGLMPSRNQLHSQWTLVYSLEQHGASLSTLYSRCEPPRDTRPGYVLVVRDRSHSVFGAYVNEHFRVSELKRFYGNGDCFLWKYNQNKRDQKIINLVDLNDNASTNSNSSETSNNMGIPKSNAPRFQAFPYTGLNDFVIFSTPNFLSLGGGDGHYGLWLDSNLEKGVSSHSLTFGNDPLSNFGTKFEIIGLEVWRVGS